MPGNFSFQAKRKASRSATKTAAVLAITIFVVEALFMLVIPDHVPRGEWSLALLDGFLLSVVLLPVMYFLIFRSVSLNRATEARLLSLFETPAVGIIISDSDGDIVDCNLTAKAMFGYAPDDVMAAGIATLLAEFPDAAWRIGSAGVVAAVAQPASKRREAAGRRRDGSTFPLEVVTDNLQLDGALRLISFITDVTERRRTEQTMRELSQAVESSASSIIITNLDAQITYVNQAFFKQTGYVAAEVIGQNPRFLQSGKTPPTTFADMWDHLTQGAPWRGEFINQRKDGREYVELVRADRIRDSSGDVTGYMAIKDDVTELKRAESHIQRLAHFDQLTGLPNRTLLEDRFERALTLAERDEDHVAVLFLDVDHFNQVNDSLGRRAGDALLMELSRRFSAVVDEGDTVSRVEADEFIFILSRTDQNAAAILASRLLEVMTTPHPFEGYELTVTPSIGVALYPEDGQDVETLAKNAEAAMRRAQRSGRNNFRFFTQAMQAHSKRKLALVSALRHAQKRGELSLHYQPQVSMNDGRIVGAEALLRWTHPELGRVSPGEFIPIAEANGMIVAIGEWVLRTAVIQMKRWLEQGLPNMMIAVNLSAIQFHHADLVDNISAILAEVGLPPELLELELTEAVAMDDAKAAVEIMNRLHERGVRMSIDDFGTGFSSLSYLKQFKVYKLKIDQSFIRDISDDTDDRAIVTAVIDLAASLGLQTIAEGVETADQLDFVRQRGCDEVQGYFFSRPLPAAEFEAYCVDAPAARRPGTEPNANKFA